MDEYKFELKEDEGCLVAAFTGQISTHCYTEFRDDYNEICRSLSVAESPRLIIDLTETSFFGSLFIGMILKLSVTVGNQDGQFALCGLSDQLNELMKKLMLLERNSDAAKHLKHYVTRAEAIHGLMSLDA
ncbi:MAG: STAS domain-containing protein [Fuerstiella sp.]